MLMERSPALHTQAPIHHAALKVRRYIGLICNSCHGDTMDKVAYRQLATKQSVGCDRVYAATLWR
jgi:hypothetical protein